MSVQYRAIWKEDLVDGAGESDPLARRQAIAIKWALRDSATPSLEVGENLLALSKGGHRTVKFNELAESGFELITEERNDNAQVWTTVVQVVMVEGVLNSLVELRMESEDLSNYVSVSRPAIVHELLEVASKPTVDSTVLLDRPIPIPANGIDILTGLLADENRSIPIIVCSEPGAGQSYEGQWLSLASKIARRTEGIANVFTLDSAAVTAFRNELGDLAIWGGGVRVYAPLPVTRDSNSWNHRYYTHDRLRGSERSSIERIVYSISQRSSRRKVSSEFEVFASNSVDAESLGKLVADTESQLELMEFERDLAIEERGSVVKQLAHAQGHLARLKEELLRKGMVDLLWETIHDDGTSIPDEVQDTSEAILAAQSYLDKWLSIPDSASRELEAIDTSVESYSWGNGAWRGFRALAAYAEDRSNGWDQGGFYEWCQGGAILGWPASPKKIAMTESDGVQDRPKLRRTRVFAVDSAVDESGKIMMLAHLKIAEGGGSLAPRIYFYDDTSGRTQKVHVGFVGPHHLVPNQSAS